MFEYELMYFFIGAPIWNLPVIIGSCVGFSRARKGKSPVGAFLIGIIVICILSWGDYSLNKSRNTGYLFSEEVIISMVFFVIYLCVMLPLAIRRYHKAIYEKTFYCLSCDSDYEGDVREEPPAHFKCPKCGAPLVNTMLSSKEWDGLSNAEKVAVKHRLMKPAEAEPAEAEPAEAEPVEAEPVETEPVKQANNDSSFSKADEIRKYKSLMDEGIITQEDFDKKKKQLLGL